MSKLRHIVINSIYLTISRYLVYILQAVYGILLARYLQPEKYGLLNWVISIVSILNILVGFGLETLLIREIARQPNKANEYYAKGLFIKFIMALVMLIGLFLILFLSNSSHTYLFILVAIFSFIGLLANSSIPVYRGLERMNMEFGQILFANLFHLIIALIAIIYLKVDLLHLISLYVATSLFSLLTSIFILRKYFFIDSFFKYFKFDINIAKNAIILALWTAAGAVYVNTDRIMLGIFSSNLSILLNW